MSKTRTFPNSIAARLVMLISLALLPLGLISVYQTRAVIKEARAVSRAGLLSETEAASGHERELIVQALGAAEGLAAALNVTDLEACHKALSGIVQAEPIFIFAGYIQASGWMECSSSGQAFDFSDFPGIQEAIETRGPLVRLTQSSAVTQQAVILATQPVIREGELLGFVTLQVPHWVLNAALLNDPDHRDLRLTSINAQGDIVAATGGVDTAAAYLPQGISKDGYGDLVGHTFLGRSHNGQDRFFAVTSMVDDTLYLVGSWPVEDLARSDTTLRANIATMFPVLMWVAGIAVAYFGLRRLVVRHIKQLQSAMRRFALGDRRETGLELDNPPDELADAQRAFNRMALIISDAESQKEQDLHDREVLLREVHHRVKNNLQLIASIMNMQSRNAHTPEARHMLDGLQRRVRGLAMLHRSLYATPEMTTVDSAELAATVVEDVSHLAADPELKIETDLASIALYPDQAVPLSMLMAEALTNALKYAGAPDGAKTEIFVSLTEAPDCMVRLHISNTLPDQAPDLAGNGTGDGLGSRLMKAFINQLDGEASYDITSTRYAMDVVFPRRDFDQCAALNNGG